MSVPQASLRAQLWRKKPISPISVKSSEGLERSIGTFTLMMFGVGSTVGTGVFFVMHEAVPDAGPAVIISFVLAGLAAGLSALSYAEMASTVPVSGSTYSYAYATLGEVVAMGVAACLLLEYGVSTAAVSVGWSGYLNQLLHNLFGWQIPNALSAAPWDTDPGLINLPALILVAMCALLLIRGASESAKVNATMVVIKLGGPADVRRDRLHRRSTSDNFADFAPKGVAGHHGGRRDDLLHVHRSRRHLDGRRRGARPAEDDAARHPRRPRDRHDDLHPGRRLRAGHPAVAGVRRRGAGRGRSGQDPAGRRRGVVAGHDPVRRRGHLDLLGDARDDVRADPHPVRDRPRRAPAAGVRAGQPAHPHARQQHRHRRDRRRPARRVHPARLPVGPGVHRHPRSRSSSSRSASSSCAAPGPTCPAGSRSPATRSPRCSPCWPASTSCPACTGTRTRGSCSGSSVVLAFYFLWGRQHSLLQRGLEADLVAEEDLR